MNITDNVFLQDKIDADNLWSKKDYQGAANKLYQAAKFANDILNNHFLSKSLLVEYHLANVISPGNIKDPKISMLLSAINDLLDLRLDDRLPAKLTPYQIYFSTVLAYNQQDYEKLIKQQKELSEKQNRSYVDILSLCVLSMGIAKYKFNTTRPNLETEKRRLSDDLLSLANDPTLPPELSDFIGAFATNLLKNKIEPSSFEELHDYSDNIIVLDLKNKFTDILNKFRQRQKFPTAKKGDNLLALNYGLFLLFCALAGAFFLLKSNLVFSVLSFVIGVFGATSGYIFKPEKLTGFLRNSRVFLIFFIAFSAAIATVIVIQSSIPNDNKIIRIDGRKIEFYYYDSALSVNDRLYILDETVMNGNQAKIGGEKLAIIQVVEVLKKKERYAGTITHITLGNESLNKIKEGLPVTKSGADSALDLSIFLPFGEISKVSNYDYYLNFPPGKELSKGTEITVLGDKLYAYNTQFSTEIAGKLKIVRKELNHYIASPIDSSKNSTLKSRKYVVVNNN